MLVHQKQKDDPEVPGTAKVRELITTYVANLEMAVYRNDRG